MTDAPLTMSAEVLIWWGLAALAGAGLGAAFFGGLWWSLRKSLASPRPGLWHFASLMLRTGGALAGFFVIGAGQWQRMVACLIGFVLARIWVTRCLLPATEARHAPQH